MTWGTPLIEGALEQPTVTIEQLTVALRRRRYRYATESELQAALAAALSAERIPFMREVALGPRARIDFMVGALGLEVKVLGSRSAVLEQLQRYAASSRVAALVLVTDRAQLDGMPATIGGKALAVVSLWNGLR